MRTAHCGSEGHDSTDDTVYVRGLPVCTNTSAYARDSAGTVIPLPYVSYLLVGARSKFAWPPSVTWRTERGPPESFLAASLGRVHRSGCPAWAAVVLAAGGRLNGAYGMRFHADAGDL